MGYCHVKVKVYEGVLMVCEEVSGEFGAKMWYFVGATTMSFLGEDI